MFRGPENTHTGLTCRPPVGSPPLPSPYRPRARRTSTDILAHDWTVVRCEKLLNPHSTELVEVKRPSERLQKQSLSHLRKLQRIPKLPYQSIPQRTMDVGCEFRVGGEDRQRVILCLRQHVQLSGDVGQFELWQAMLTRAEKFAGASKLQIHLGDFETVACARHRVEALLCAVG